MIKCNVCGYEDNGTGDSAHACRAPDKHMSEQYKNAVCRGSWALGSACGKCERCIETNPNKSKCMSEQNTAFEKIISNMKWGKKLDIDLRKDGAVYPYKYDLANILFELFQAATLESAKRIAELEGEIAELKSKCESLDIEFDQRDDKRLAQIAELQSNNNDLREALGNARILADEILNGQQASDVLAMRIMSVADTALAATPAESLAKHDDEVIEKVIFVINQYYDINHIRDDVIRELKGK